MAFLEKRNERYRLAFRFGGKIHRHNLGTATQVEAEGCLARVEENLRLLERGRLEVPDGADLALFLISDGKVATRPQPVAALTLEDLRTGFVASQGASLEANTLQTIAIHFRHLVATLGASFDVRKLTLTHLERHISRRSKMPGRKGRPLNAVTIRKEVQTLSAAWTWAGRRKLVDRPFPSVGLVYPKTTEKPPFQTRAEIEAQIGRGIATDEADSLWKSLFLTLVEVAEVLELVQARALHPWLWPMVAVAAHTGARRSEILRSRVGDWDLAGGTGLVREKKRAKGKITTRRVPVSPYLGRTLKTWFEGEHPGGPWLAAQGLTVARGRKVRSGPEPVSVDESNNHLRQTLAGTRWAMIGWHTFRHSFASNCAARGVDERLIDGWMGHQTEAMRKRYRHLLPDQQSQAIRDVFGQGE